MDAMSSTNVTEISFDTNILFYGFDRRDVTKHRIANVVLDRCFAPDNPIAMQVLAEFYRSAARKLVRPEAAKAIVEDYLQGMRVISAETSDLRSAMQLHQAGELQFFDALVLVTLGRSGCTRFFSEDMQHRRAYMGLRLSILFYWKLRNWNRCFRHSRAPGDAFELQGGVEGAAQGWELMPPAGHFEAADQRVEGVFRRFCFY